MKRPGFAKPRTIITRHFPHITIVGGVHYARTKTKQNTNQIGLCFYKFKCKGTERQTFLSALLVSQPSQFTLFSYIRTTGSLDQAYSLLPWNCEIFCNIRIVFLINCLWTVTKGRPVLYFQHLVLKACKIPCILSVHMCNCSPPCEHIHYSCFFHLQDSKCSP